MGKQDDQTLTQPTHPPTHSTNQKETKTNKGRYHFGRNETSRAATRHWNDVPVRDDLLSPKDPASCVIITFDESLVAVAMTIMIMMMISCCYCCEHRFAYHENSIQKRHGRIRGCLVYRCRSVPSSPWPMFHSSGRDIHMWEISSHRWWMAVPIAANISDIDCEPVPIQSDLVPIPHRHFLSLYSQWF